MTSPHNEPGFLFNRLTGSRPLIVHAPGHHRHKPHWLPIRERFFATPAQRIGAVERLTVLTCNNGHQAMGLLEKSLKHLGVPCHVAGRGVHPWINSRDKPAALLQASREINTEFLLYIDSRDAVLLDNPAILLERFRSRGDCDLLFSADRMNWPPRKEFQRFEDRVAGDVPGGFRYLNGGAWIGRTAFCREFWAAAQHTPPVPQAPDSEQGILKTLFPLFYPRVRLDYECALFQNIGFVVADIFDLV